MAEVAGEGTLGQTGASRDRSGEQRRPLASRFELAPPRGFMFPAILLLVSERPGYGYGLVPRLQELRFGHVDRPAIYRALAQLEHDGLLEASSQSPRAGQARRVYRITPLGARLLASWMGVIKEEHDQLGEVLRRYQATGTTEAVLAEVGGRWNSGPGGDWSTVAASTVPTRRLVPVDDPGEARPLPAQADDRPGPPRSLRLIPERSVVLVEVRSTAGPLSFGAIGVSGSVAAVESGGRLAVASPARGRVEIDMSGLSSGNRLHDAELLRRIEARRFPRAVAELRQCQPSGPGSRYRLEGELTFHGVTRAVEGTVNLARYPDGRVVITGEQVFDIRDFALSSPTVLMLRIYPDVRVRLHAEATTAELVGMDDPR